MSTRKISIHSDSLQDKLRYRLHRYGITPDRYRQLRDFQDGRCAVCGVQSDALVVDHNHSTGFVRGLLCVSCNTGLGNFRDSLDVMEKALAYLRSGQRHGLAVSLCGQALLRRMYDAPGGIPVREIPHVMKQMSEFGWAEPIPLQEFFVLKLTQSGRAAAEFLAELNGLLGIETDGSHCADCAIVEKPVQEN